MLFRSKLPLLPNLMPSCFYSCSPKTKSRLLLLLPCRGCKALFCGFTAWVTLAPPTIPSKPYSLLPNSETPNGPSLLPLLPLSPATLCLYTQFLYTFNLITLNFPVHFHFTSRLIDRQCCEQNLASNLLNWSNLIF